MTIQRPFKIVKLRKVESFRFGVFGDLYNKTHDHTFR